MRYPATPESSFSPPHIKYSLECFGYLFIKTDLCSSIQFYLRFIAFSFRFSAEHQNFLHLTYGENLKTKLYIDHSNVTIVYRPKSDNVDRMIVDQGVVVAPLDPLLEGRLIVEGSELIMKKVQVADMGVFKVTDLAGFPVAHIYIEVDGKMNLQGKIKTPLALL